VAEYLPGRQAAAFSRHAPWAYMALSVVTVGRKPEMQSPELTAPRKLPSSSLPRSRRPPPRPACGVSYGVRPSGSPSEPGSDEFPRIARGSRLRSLGQTGMPAGKARCQVKCLSDNLAGRAPGCGCRAFPPFRHRAAVVASFILFLSPRKRSGEYPTGFCLPATHGDECRRTNRLSRDAGV
jgi:hypothetical protein